MKTYFDIQKKKFKIDETNARTRAKEVELTLISKKVEIMAANTSKMTPKKKTWFEGKQKFIQDRDA